MFMMMIATMLRGDPEKCDNYGNTGLHLSAAKVFLCQQNRNTKKMTLATSVYFFPRATSTVSLS